MFGNATPMLGRTVCRQAQPRLSRLQKISPRLMSQTRSAKALLSHEERTAAEPRQAGLHAAAVSSVTIVNEKIKKLKFDIKDRNGFNFLAGQWLDVFVPGVEKAGGFTMTSSPQDALPQMDQKHTPFFELAIQDSPHNPAAAWLWQPVEEILGKEVNVRVGGSFVWPPSGVGLDGIKRVVFIAGGVGINPIMSMLSYMHHSNPSPEVRLLYSTKVPSRDSQPSEVLFLAEILHMFRTARLEKPRDGLELFFTGTLDGSALGARQEAPTSPLMALTLLEMDSHTEVPVLTRTHRIDESALISVVGNQEIAQQSVFYVCGPPHMADEIVDFLKQQPTVTEKRVLCEKWW